MNSKELRKLFLNFFKDKGHIICKSASLIPDDPTLLFTVAGMVPFKNYFLGKVPLPFTRAASIQKCLRTNDIEEVGKTRRHHTFFEMLGNFSFGDYFKEEAIKWAWEFLVDVVKISKKRLYITVYKDDEDAYKIWRDVIKVPENRIFRMGKETNFWEMGEVGPCGYCSEIYFDLEGGDSIVKKEDIENNGDRFLEVWNLVFTEFDKKEDGTLTELKQKNIDTGMGLERLAAVSQGVISNFETDLFMPIIKEVAKNAGILYGRDEKKDISLRVIADHIRGITFLIGDGILPSNEGRGYVLRRLIRRAIRHGRFLGFSEPFLYRLINTVVHMMNDNYPELGDRKEYIIQVVKMEEDKFQITLDKGLDILNEEITKIKKNNNKKLSGEVVFKLYDTYGFPVEITEEILRENNLIYDKEKFNSLMENQRTIAKTSWKGIDIDEKEINEEVLKNIEKTIFTGYENFQENNCEILLIIDIKNKKVKKEAFENEEVYIILDKTPFYGESGGQIGDTGKLENSNFSIDIIDTQRINDVFLHKGKIKKGIVRVNEKVNAIIDVERRKSIMRHHTATHLLHAALRKILGNHVEQAGSYVGDDRLRFDFTHFENISYLQLKEIERQINEWVLEDYKVNVEIMDVDSAKKTGAIALFEEKYRGKVRVVSVADISKELCAGTHLDRIGKIGLFKIISSTSTAAGIRRIEAVAGKASYSFVNSYEDFITTLKENLKANELNDLKDKIYKLIEENKSYQKKLENLSKENVLKNVDSYIEKAEEINNLKILILKFENIDKKIIRELGDVLKIRVENGVIFIVNVQKEKVNFLCILTGKAKEVLDASFLAKEASKICGGSGGGRKDRAEAGGKDVKKIDDAIKKVRELIKGKIN